MAQEFSNTAKGIMLDALTANLIGLHSGDPGSSGTSNEISGGGYSRQAATFNAASSGSRTLASDVSFTCTASQSITWISVWNSTGPVFIGRTALTGDVAANSAGAFTVVATTTLLTISDP